MTALRNLLFLAVAAGILVGVAMTLMQQAFTVPLILAAETYETAAAAVPAHDHGVEAIAPHEHDAEAWAPADGLSRTGFTFLANVITAVGFGLLLIAASEFAGGIRDWRQGVFWGLAGFAVFVLAPGLGLPPELPAMPAADLDARQVWWVGTVLATGAALGLLVYGRSPWLAALAVALLVLPHLIGAPQPASFESPIPEGLHHRFVVAVTLTGLVFWVLLGVVVALMRPRFAAGLSGAEPRLA